MIAKTKKIVMLTLVFLILYQLAPYIILVTYVYNLLKLTDNPVNNR